MLGINHHYYGTIRAMVASFGYLFSDIQIRREQRDGVKFIKVPLHFSAQDRIFQFKTARDTTYITSYPRMAFDFQIGGVDDQRKTSKQIVHNFKATQVGGRLTSQWARNFVPYDFDFTLYVTATDITDSLQIIEQILPHFQPSLTIKIKPFNDYPDFVTDVTVILNSISNDFEIVGDLLEDTKYNWTLNFTLKGFMFSPIHQGELGIIEVASVNMKEWGIFREEIQTALDESETESGTTTGGSTGP